MANITPFKGIRYNPEKIKNLADVYTPPYDVISKTEQQYFYDRHPNNIIRLILGITTANDTDTDNPHTRASNYFNTWLSDNILLQGSSPAIYLTSVQFSTNNHDSVTRYGMIVLVGLEPFEKGIILPHEKTFSKVKSERLNLMKACHANFSPIFSLYSDQKNTILKRLKEQASKQLPDMDFIDYKGLRHGLWRITEEPVLRFVGDAMADKTLFIADGHHRYETALNYRSWLSKGDPDFSARHPANFVMMYLSCMDEPGLTILPAHRMLKGFDNSTLDSFVRKADKYFDITTLTFNENDKKEIRNKFLLSLKANSSEKTIGICIKHHPEFYLLKERPKVMEQLFSNELSESLINLDVTVLTRLVFMEILGLDQEMLDNEKMISYTSNAEEAIDAVASNSCDIAFILNPTKIEQVKRVAEEGLIMPRKATYFYPKVIVGQVMHKLFCKPGPIG